MGNVLSNFKGIGIAAKQLDFHFQKSGDRTGASPVVGQHRFPLDYNVKKNLRRFALSALRASVAPF